MATRKPPDSNSASIGVRACRISRNGQPISNSTISAYSSSQGRTSGPRRRHSPGKSSSSS